MSSTILSVLYATTHSLLRTISYEIVTITTFITFARWKTRLGCDIKQSNNSRHAAEKTYKIDIKIKLEMLVYCRRMRGILKFNSRIEIVYISPANSNRNV